MTRRKRTADDWRKVVYGTRKSVISWSCKVYLLYLSDWMGAERKVSRPRHLVAADLSVSERAVTRMTAEAHDAGFLSTVVRGRKGVTAVYQGVFPDRVSGTTVVPLKQPGSSVQRDKLLPPESGRFCPPETAFSGTTVGPPIETTEQQCVACSGWGCERCAS